MKLSNLVDVIVNNEECVVLKTKDNTVLDLISLGCFDGDETMLRITKGEQHTATIFQGSKHFSWNWGKNGYTLVTDKIKKCGRLIQECVEEDFGIYIGSNRAKIKSTLHIKSLSDKSNKKHNLKILYWSGKENKECQIHKDGEHFKWFTSIKNARDYISEHFDVQSSNFSTAHTGCKVEEYLVISK